MRHAHRRCRSQGIERQLERGREVVEEIVQHGAAAIAGIAEVAVQQVAHVGQILQRQRLVQPVAMPDLGELYRGEASLPATRAAGSAGTTCETTKVITLTPRITKHQESPAGGQGRWS